ncbi:cytochrome P450 [Xylariaceae sp. FL0255]|nr:cytochrome P450 [Xylariaceae sp. FL0255]
MASLALLSSYIAPAIVVYIYFVLGYRVLLHPLRQYPGPLAAKLSGAYNGIYALKGSLHLETYRQHTLYGSVVRQAPTRLVFNTVKALQDIYQNDRIAKSFVYGSITQGGQSNIFTTINKSEHRPKRKLISQLLSDQSVRAFEPVINERVNTFLHQLAAPGSKPSPNMTLKLRHLGLEVAGLLGFGYNLQLQTKDTHRFLTKAITLGNYRANACMQYPPLADLKIDKVLNLLPDKLRESLISTVTKMITARLAEPVDARHDLLSVFHSATDVDMQNIGQSELWAEAFFFFLAGGETIASALSAAFFYLSRNPECYKKLAKEIRSVFSSGAEISGGARLSRCRYLRAWIDESLRMSPPVPSTLWREAVVSPDLQDSQQPLIIDGHVVPSGTQVGVNIYCLHHNEEYFPEPFKFSPERWLVDDTAIRQLATHNALTAFSLGPRSCAGKAMAYLEMSIVLAKTLWYFDFETAPSEQAGSNAKQSGVVREAGEFPVYDFFAVSHDGPRLVFRPRSEYFKELSSELP